MSDLLTMLIIDEREQIAKRLLENGAEVDFVQKITDLDIETIQRLKEELDNR